MERIHKIFRTRQELLRVKKTILRKIAAEKKQLKFLSRDLLEQFLHNEVALEILSQMESDRCTLPHLCMEKKLNYPELDSLINKTGALNCDTIIKLYDLQ